MRRAAFLLLLLAACREEPVPPAAIEMGEDTAGHLCLMQLDGHGGPKAQVHVRGHPAPLFFAQVRDAIAWMRTEPQGEVLAAYVTDMGRAASWDEPGPGIWVSASDATFVVGSGVAGGMGAPEVVPFGTPAAARAFAAEHGGSLSDFAAIPDAAVLGPVEPIPDRSD